MMHINMMQLGKDIGKIELLNMKCKNQKLEV